MKPSISEAEFDLLAAQTGLPLNAAQKRTLNDAYLDAGGHDRPRQHPDAA